MKLNLGCLICSSLAVFAVVAQSTREERRAALLNNRANRRTLFSDKLSASAALSKRGGGPGGFAGPIADGSNIKTIKATVTVPSISIPPGRAASGKNYGVAAWVGITGSGALWQAGIFASISGTNPVDYSLFYEWFPLGAASFPNAFTFGAGDELLMTVEAGSSTSGTATIEKMSTGESVMITLTGQSTIGGRSNAEFLVEDYGGSNGGSIPFASWNPAFQFAECSFSDDNSSTEGISGDGFLEVTHGGHSFTSTKSISGHAFSVTYTGDAANS